MLLGSGGGSFSGMDPERAKGLAEQLDELAHALVPLGLAIDRSLERWGGDARVMANLRREALWADEAARDLRKRAFMIARQLTDDELRKIGLPDYFWGLPDNVQDAWLYLHAGPAAVTKFGGKTRSTVTSSLRAKDEILKYLSYRKALDVAATHGTDSSEALRAWLEHQDLLGRMEAGKGALLRRIIGDARFTRISPVLDTAGKASLPTAVALGVKDTIWPEHQGARGVADRGVGMATTAAAGTLAITTLGSSTALGVALSMTVFPPAAAVVLAGAAAYAVGNIVYDNRKAIGKAFRSAGEWSAYKIVDVGRQIDDSVHMVTHPQKTLQNMFKGFG